MSKSDTTQKKQLESNQISKELQLILNDLPKKKQEEIKAVLVSLTVSEETSFSGPLPPPQLLKAYSSVVDNGAERIFKMAENQSKHRIDLESHAIKEELLQSRRGQIFGFILGIVGLILATVLAFYGYETIAGIFGTTTIGALVTVFVIGKKQQSNTE